MLETKTNDTLEGREEAEAVQAEQGWAPCLQAPKPGPFPGTWADQVPQPGSNGSLEPHPRLGPQADPQALASSPPCQV